MVGRTRGGSAGEETMATGIRILLALRCAWLGSKAAVEL